MKVLVTGASGFVGRHLVARLAETGVSVRAAVRRPGKLPFEAHAVGEIDGETDWSGTLLGLDAVVHLAAYAHVTNPAKVDPALLERTNVQGTANLARQAADAGVKHFIFVSSIGAMADSCETKLTAESSCHPTTPYGQSKLAAEKEMMSAAGARNMAWTILRPPLVYGEGNPGNMRRLLGLIKARLPLPLASVRNRRSFLYVGNLVDVIALCLGKPKAFGKIFLPSDGDDISTPELIRAIARASASVEEDRRGKIGDGSATHHTSHVKRHTPWLFPFPERLLKVMARLPGLGALRKLTSSLYVDSEPLRRELRWAPPFTMDEGLRRTLIAPTEKADQSLRAKRDNR